jgi:hypothetical protein
VFYLLAADAVLITHALFVAFVVFGLFLVIAGGLLKWSWVRNIWFRVTHLIAIGIVVLQSWFGVLCPLTTWEMALRGRAGETAYTDSFIAYWLNRVLFYQAPDWVFITGYTLFGGLVLVSWFCVQPRWIK